MALPANDAFTIGMPHDPARNIGLRSSTKIPFVSRSPPATVRRTHSQPRQMSEDTHPSLTRRLPHPPQPPPSLSATIRSANGHVRHRKKARPLSSQSQHKPRPPPDWEIPRKTLHSSIGFLTLHLYATNGNPRTVVYVLGLALLVIIPADIVRLNSDRFEWLFERCLGFLMRESERKSTNGVIWYIIGVMFVLSVYPLDIATVSILILSWADTAASTIGRLWGAHTPPLPRYLPLIPLVPFFRLPLAPRKSLAGFLAASFTGAAIAIGFWGFCHPVRDTQLAFHLPSQDTIALVTEQLPHPTRNAVREAAQRTVMSLGTLVGHVPVGRWVGLATLAIVSGVISGTAEALDLGSLDDNLTLPIISGGCMWVFFKVLHYFTGSA